MPWVQSEDTRLPRGDKRHGARGTVACPDCGATDTATRYAEPRLDARGPRPVILTCFSCGATQRR